MNKYLFYKKLIINKKTRNIYKKGKSNKLYIKYKNNMINLKKYKKIIKSKKIIKKKGGFINGISILDNAYKSINDISDASKRIPNDIVNYAYRFKHDVDKNVQKVQNALMRDNNVNRYATRETARRIGKERPFARTDEGETAVLPVWQREENRVRAQGVRLDKRREAARAVIDLRDEKRNWTRRWQ